MQRYAGGYAVHFILLETKTLEKKSQGVLTNDRMPKSVCVCTVRDDLRRFLSLRKTSCENTCEQQQHTK